MNNKNAGNKYVTDNYFHNSLCDNNNIGFVNHSFALGTDITITDNHDNDKSKNYN